MDLKRLFPPSSQTAKDETCIIGEHEFRLEEVEFLPITKQDIPSATFIDGGSASIFGTPARCIGIIKVCAVRTEGLQRKEIITHQYLVSITTNGDGFVVQSEALGPSDEYVGQVLNCEITGLREFTPEMLLDPLRAMAERALAPQGIVVHDGSFRTTNQLLQRLVVNKNACALSKTSGILTSKQRPIGMALLTRAPKGSWMAKLAPGISCVRLNDRAAHTFILEGNCDDALPLLSAWSADMTFPGYPYPLVLADQMARVTNNERDAWRIVLSSDENAMKILADELKATDAHAMLEHILYGR